MSYNIRDFLDHSSDDQIIDSEASKLKKADYEEVLIGDNYVRPFLESLQEIKKLDESQKETALRLLEDLFEKTKVYMNVFREYEIIKKNNKEKIIDAARRVDLQRRNKHNELCESVKTLKKYLFQFGIITGLPETKDRDKINFFARGLYLYFTTIKKVQEVLN